MSEHRSSSRVRDDADARPILVWIRCSALDDLAQSPKARQKPCPSAQSSTFSTSALGYGHYYCATKGERGCPLRSAAPAGVASRTGLPHLPLTRPLPRRPSGRRLSSTHWRAEWGSLVQLAHLLWTHLLDQEQHGRFAILEGVVYGVAVASSPAPRLRGASWSSFRKRDRSTLAGNLGAIALIAGGLMCRPRSSFRSRSSCSAAKLSPVGLSPVWSSLWQFHRSRIAQTVNEARSQPTRAALWSEFVDGTRPFIAISALLPARNDRRRMASQIRLLPRCGCSGEADGFGGGAFCRFTKRAPRNISLPMTSLRCLRLDNDSGPPLRRDCSRRTL